MAGLLLILAQVLLLRIADAAPFRNLTACAKTTARYEGDTPTPRGNVMTAGAIATISFGVLFMLMTIIYYAAQCGLRAHKRAQKGKANCTETPLNTLSPRTVEILREPVAADEANDRRWRAIGVPVNDNNGQVAPPSPAPSHVSKASLVSNETVRPPLSTFARATDVTRQSKAAPVTEAAAEARAVSDAAIPGAKVSSAIPANPDGPVVSEASASSKYSEHEPSEEDNPVIQASRRRSSL